MIVLPRWVGLVNLANMIPVIPACKESINDNDDKLSILMIMMRSHCNEDTNNALHAHNYDGWRTLTGRHPAAVPAVKGDCKSEKFIERK